MQEKKRKKKNPAAEQEEQTKKMQSVAETASEQPTAEEPPTKTNGFRLSQYKRKPTDRLDFGRSCNLCCSVGCHAADAAASISG